MFKIVVDKGVPAALLLVINMECEIYFAKAE